MNSKADDNKWQVLDTTKKVSKKFSFIVYLNIEQLSDELFKIHLLASKLLTSRQNESLIGLFLIK